MDGWPRGARRLAASGALALVLTAGCAAVAPDPGRQAAAAVGDRTGTAAPRPAASGGADAPVDWPLPDGPATPARREGPLLGVVGYEPSVLARLDPRTLRPLPGPRIRFRGSLYAHAWSPDRSVLALGDFDQDVLHLVDPVRIRRLGAVRFGIADAQPWWIHWLGPRRVAVVTGTPTARSHLVVVDPVARRVRSRQELPLSDVAVRAGDRLVLLSTAMDRVAPARLQVVDGRGRVRTVELLGIPAGFVPPVDWRGEHADGESRSPGLAVDPAGGRAFVAAAGTRVAEVDLASLGVAYHDLLQPVPLLRRLARWLVPSAEAKLVAGSWRAACWLGGDTLAVWGVDSRVVGEEHAELRQEQAPSGLKLIDTRSWTLRPLDPAAAAASWQSGRLLAYGATWDMGMEHSRGSGLTIYGPGDRPPVHLLGRRAVTDAQLNGDLIYAAVEHGGDQPGHAVVSVPDGRVLASSRRPMPRLLVDPGDRSC